MADGSPRDISGLPSPDPTASEGNSSVQVNVDTLSNRGRSVGRRSRSPSIRPSPSRGQSLARQATANSLSSFLSSQPSSQTSQTDRLRPEDVLRDLIDAPESSGGTISDPTSGGQHGIKRPHDDEMTGEPSAKRDKLEEELDRMSALAHPAPVSNAMPSSSSGFMTSSATVCATPTNGIPITSLRDTPFTMGTRGTLPIRVPRPRPPHPGNGTALSRSGIPEASEPTSSVDDESGHSSDGRET